MTLASIRIRNPLDQSKGTNAADAAIALIQGTDQPTERTKRKNPI